MISEYHVGGQLNAWVTDENGQSRASRGIGYWSPCIATRAVLSKVASVDFADNWFTRQMERWLRIPPVHEDIQ
jgi:hypothetical protein